MPTPNTIPHLFEQTVAYFPNQHYLFDHDGVQYRGISYQTCQDLVRKIAAALLNMKLGHNDKLAIISEGRSEWVLSELSMYYVRAVNVPISIKLIEDADLIFRLNHAEVKVIFSSKTQLERLRRIKNQLKHLECLILFDEEDAREEHEMQFSELLKLGQQYYHEHTTEVDTCYQLCSCDDIANICYTSGTTADPKGILLSQGNYVANVQQALDSIPQVDSSYRSLFILPLDHSFAHTVGIYILMARGASMYFVQQGATPAETLRNIPKNIQESQATFLLSVPALAKNFSNKIISGIQQQGPLVQRLFQWGLWASKHNKPLHAIIDQLVFKKVRKSFCASLQFFVGGGALLDTELQYFFKAIGIPMYQGYGLTEAAPIISSNSPLQSQIGSSGKVLKGIELKIVNGEIVIRGENVMKGYWKNPKATAEALVDGWLHTGDLGSLSPDGYLYVQGRFKSLLIGGDGEKYSPEGIEESLVELEPWIDQVLVYNNQSTFTAALVVLNTSELKSYLAKHQLDPHQASDLSKLLQELKQRVEQFKQKSSFPERWLPSALMIASQAFTESNGMMNSTLKIVRHKVVEMHQDLIDHTYTPEGRTIDNVMNANNLKRLLNINP